MRDVAAAQAKLDTQYGTEPIIIVEIQWVDGGQRCAYADRKIADSVLGQIVEIGSIDSAMKADFTTDSSQVQLVLEDTDGKIKAICDSHDLHKRPVWVYQWFDGLALSDKFLLFKGEINSPFSWNEGDRTVSFDVTTRIEDVEAGFSMEEGDFPIVPVDALGKAWPLVFGSVCDVKAVQVRAPRYGTLQSGEGIHDYTLESRICQARKIQCPNVPTGTTQTMTEDTQAGPDPNDPGRWILQADNQQEWGPDPNCVEDRFYTICDLMYQLQQQMVYEHNTITIIGASNLFPQNERITIDIEGGKFTGSFSGDVFTITSREHPDLIVNPPTTCVTIDDRTFRPGLVLEGGLWEKTEGGTAWRDIRTEDTQFNCDEEIAQQAGRVSDGGPVTSRKVFDDMATSSFFWARAGSKVFLEAETEVLYIVNLLPCTITRVAAMKNTALGPRLVTVPAEYYTIYETDYDGYTVTEIGMTKPLSKRSEIVTDPDGIQRMEASKWSDDLYVTLTSSVGPNPVDIISWLLGKYTSVDPDPTSFGYVHDRLEIYPTQFALLERKNVMELIADIAMQSRCAVYVRDDVMYIKYMSEEPDSIATITESVVLANSLKIGLTSTEEIATKHLVTWRRNETEGKLKIILKHNVAKYGTHEKTHDYYTQNIYDNVLKSSTFWMIRDANAWKVVEFSVPLKYLALEVFDCVTLSLSDLPSVKAVITAIKYDVANEQLDITCWTPLRAGESSPYIHAWPADIAAGTIFPTAEERAAGLGYEFTVAPPAGHLLYAVRADDGQPSAVLTSGDPSPSDLDDVLGSCFCPADEDVIDERDPKFDALRRAKKADQGQVQNQMNGGINANDQSEKQRVCGSALGGCVYKVVVQYITPILVGQGNGGCTGPCGGTGCGIACTGSFQVVCHTFGAMWSATRFAANIKAEALRLQQQCAFCVGQIAPYSASVTAIAPSGWTEPCESPPGDMNMPNQGEVAKRVTL